MASTITLRRRRFIATGVIGASLGFVARRAHAQGGYLLTPAQTEGPFYPVVFPDDVDADLLDVRGAGAAPRGTALHLSGRILDRRARPLPEARVEIWQCDASGIYFHPGDARFRDFDRAFQGYGRMTTDAGGAYAFRTLRPAPYVGRTPHIHFRVTAPGGKRLTTQMYVAGEPGNERDGLYSRLRTPELRRLLSATLESAPERGVGALKASFDILMDV
jgi:protocatechuate 3,4-dioxygenase beta subunit